MDNYYSRLIDLRADRVAEGKSRYASLTERHIQAMWMEQKYFRPLKTVDGQCIQVISPGIWNGESGPDFLKAHLRIGDKDLRGDVEIHLNDESWIQHRHHEDERYNQVIFHLSLWKPRNLKPIIKCNGDEAIASHLEDYLTKPLHKLMQLIDLDLYPYRKFIGSGRCAQQLFRSLPESDIEDLFRSAADWRLHQKSHYLSARLPTIPLQLVGGISMGLGYKNNAEAFLELFSALLDYRHYPEQEVLAIGLGMCGFFDRKIPEEWKDSTAYQELQTLWWGHSSSVIHQAHLILDHIRPYNHPVRRLAYLAKLITDPQVDKIWTKMMSAWEEHSVECFRRNKWTALQKALLGEIPTYTDLYWNHHYTFEKQMKDEYLSLIGDTLKTEIILNVFFPLLRQDLDKSQDPRHLQAFEAFYRSIRSSTTGKSEYLTHRFFGDAPKGAIFNRAQMQQGAYQLHRDYCLHYEASCEGCPFVERFNKTILWSSVKE
jgi:hypothetical protein